MIAPPERPASGPGHAALSRRLLHGTAWSVAGNIAGQALTFASTVLVARILGRDTFGQLNIINGLIATIGTFAGLGLGLTATKYVAEFRTSDKIRAARIACALLRLGWWSGLAFTLLLWSAAHFIASRILLSPDLLIPTLISAPLVAFNTIGGLQGSLLQGLEKFRLGAFVNVARSGIVALSVVWACVLWGLNGVIAMMVVSTAATTCWYARLLRRELATEGIFLARSPISSEWRILFNFSLPALLAAVLVSPANWAASALVARLPNGFSELGMLAAANHWRQISLLIPIVLTSVLVPVLSAEHARSGRAESATYLLDQSHWVSTLIVFPVAVLAMFASEALIRLYGRDFSAGGDLIVITCGTAMVISIGTASGAAIQAQGRMWLGLSINLSYALFLLTGTALFAPRYGGRALAWAAFTSYVLISLWSFHAIRDVLLGGLSGRMYTALLFSVAMTATCFLVPAPARLWFAPVATLTALSFVVGVLIPKDERESLRSWITALAARLCQSAP